MVDEHGNGPDRAALLRQAQVEATAGRTLNGWVAGARALGVLSAALAAGVLDALRTPHTLAELAAGTGRDADAVADLCLALLAHGVAARDGEVYRLSPAFAVLTAPAAVQPFPDAIGWGLATARLLAAGGTGDYRAVAAEDALALARGASPNPTSPVRQALVASWLDDFPELRAHWAAGGRHIEFGCGAGGSLLGVVTAQPNLTAVGVERDAAVAAEARRRAATLGVAHRVEVRHMDALDTPEEAAFTSAMWAQMFFPLATRAPLLAVAHRVLEADGYLIVPSNPVPPGEEVVPDDPAWQGYAVMRLLVAGWGVPFAGLDALQAEVEAAGFAYIRRTWTGRNYWSLFRRVPQGG